MKRFFLAVLTLCLLVCLCGCNSNSDETDEHIHDLRTQVINPTCTKDGYTVYHCVTCGIFYEGDIVPALQNDGHNYSNFVCTECGDFLIDNAVDTYTLKYEKTTDENGNETYTVIGVGLYKGYIKIPATYNGIPVTQIADEAFWNLLDLKHVVLPDSIVSIGNKAFQYCFNLISINIPDSIVSIGEDAFWDCQNLKSISLGSITKVSDYAFIGCESVESIVIPDGVTEIGVHGISDCYSLKSIAIPVSVTAILHGAFSQNYNLTDIFYEGTIEQWRTIYKEVGLYNTGEDASWDAYTEDYTVHCIDGDVAKNQTNP